MKIIAITKLEVDPATKPGFVCLGEDWTIYLDDKRWVVVRAGFWCDGASIPAFATPWLSPLVLLAMGVAHDYAVRPGAVIQKRRGGEGDPFDPTTATALAVALAETAGVGRVRRWLIATALRLAVRTYWHLRPMNWAPA